MSSIKQNIIDQNKLREECGVFGIYGTKDIAAYIALGLHALQHRGQEAAGIVTYDGEHFQSHRALGLVGDNFNDPMLIEKLTGALGIGHVRYSTTGETMTRNIQPLFAEFKFGGLAVSHNGNLTNARTLRKELIERGCIFQSTMDTETIIHLIARSDCGRVVDRLVDALLQIQGAYSLVAMSQKKLIGVRDPTGVRPLVLGRKEDAYILTSETCALDIIDATFVRDVEPGEIVVVDQKGLHSLKPFGRTPHHFCIFEYIYFARPDSVIDGKSVYEVRKRIGAELARESNVPADVIVPVPDSGVPSAIGYAQTAAIPFELGIIRNHYVGRTFIEPTTEIRHLGVKLKHNANIATLKGKRVILVDDSIVRGTTAVKIVDMIRRAGAASIHMRIASPPITHPCFYGIDTPQQNDLLAALQSTDAIAKFIGVDSIAYISQNGLYRAVGDNKNNAYQQFCDACFTGNYPIPLTDQNAGHGAEQLSLLTETD